MKVRVSWRRRELFLLERGHPARFERESANMFLQFQLVCDKLSGQGCPRSI